MSAARWTLALILLAAITIAGAAQQRDAANLSLDFPVPAWPANGVIPPEMKNQFVFVDLPNNEYVVAYPENLGSPNYEKDGPAERRVHRYKLQRDVDPQVAAVVTSTGGKYKIVYAVSNGPKAKQSIDQWTLVLPEGATAATLKQPAGWFAAFQHNRKLPVANADWIKAGSAVVFSYSKPEGQIQPGDSKSGFELESDLRPGFTIGLFRQAESTDSVVQQSGNIPQIVVKNATPPPPAAGTAPPPAGGGGGFGGNQTPAAATAAWQPIKDSVDKLLQFEYNSKPIVMLAPKFSKDATDANVATDFLRGITILSKTGVLIADSPFVKSTLSDLDAYIKAGGSGQLKHTGQPKSSAETEVFNAMKLSLHLN
jgi:hypothetical protein